MLIKRIIFFGILFSCITSWAQDSALTFTAVVEIPGQTKEQLFIKGRRWLSDIMKDSRTAIRIQDKETGELIGKCKIGSFYTERRGKKDIKVHVTYDVDFSLYLKDGKYKYEFTNFECNEENAFPEAFGILTSSDSTLYKNPFMRDSRIQNIYRNSKIGIAVTMNDIVESLKNFMKAESKSDF